MRLEIESIDMKDLQPGTKTYAENHILNVNLK